MINGLRLELEDVGPIHNANININRINIIGGKNSTGKSTASKLLYCFLKANSSDRDKLVAPALTEKLEQFYLSLRYANDVENDETYGDLVEKTRRMEYFLKDRHYDDFRDIVELYEEIEFLFIMHKEKFLNKHPRKDVVDPNFQKLNQDFENIKKIIRSVEEGSKDFFQEIMSELLSSELDIDYGSLGFNYARLYDSLKNNFSFDAYFMEDSFDAKGKFNVSNVFYLESFSIFDNFYLSKSQDYDSEHVSDLKEHLFPKKRPSKMYEDKSIKRLEEIITNIVGGRIIRKGDSLRFVPLDSSYDAPMKNTASGIKQIAVIQTLLHNRFLGDNCVLIMDEPEVNLHPEWQITLAKILVRIAKEGNITIYINTHSPMFIEAIDTFCEYYDFEEFASYYLTEKSEMYENAFDFKEVPSDELYLIYDNLGDPFDYLDKVRLSKGKKGVDDDLDF